MCRVRRWLRRRQSSARSDREGERRDFLALNLAQAIRDVASALAVEDQPVERKMAIERTSPLVRPVSGVSDKLVDNVSYDEHRGYVAQVPDL